MKSYFREHAKLLGLCNILSSFSRRKQMLFSILLKVMAAKLHLNLPKQFRVDRMSLENLLKVFLPQNQSFAVRELFASSLLLPNIAALHISENRGKRK